MATSPTTQIRASSIGANVQGNVNSTAGFWTFAIVWNGIIAVFYYFANHSSSTHKPPPLIFFALLFAAGLALVISAIYVTVCRFRFGKIVFELQPLAAVPGGVVTGMIRIPKPLIYQEGIHLRLACARGEILRDADNSRREMDSVLWEDLCTLDRFALGASVGEIPVYFKIPTDARPSEKLPGGGRVFWTLSGKAKTGSIPFFASFVVPVTAGEISPEAQKIPDATLTLRSPPAIRRQPADRRVHLTNRSDGGCSVDFERGRNPSVSVFIIFFGALCFLPGVVIYKEIPNDLIFEIFGAFIALGIGAVGILLTFLGIYTLLEKVNVTIRRGSLTLERGIPLMMRTRTVTAEDVQEITVAISGQINNRPLYEIRAMQSTGKPLSISGTLSDKLDAELLAAEFKKDLAGR